MADSKRQDPPPSGQPIISEPGFIGEMNSLNKNNSKKNKP
ncbi:hypothetical protein NIES4071_77860 [Calothrix sp. NIES-4071]|nr:hypothetical protein NIES4071_77860 [Calothrix sp. NIES-4071]BAZ62059.1 hypothetical protein NIES4105_77800 [Calothrix sp. NIES-4105]